MPNRVDTRGGPIAVLNVGRMDDRVQQQTERIEYAFFTTRIDACAVFFGPLHALPIDDGKGWTRLFRVWFYRVRPQLLDTLALVNRRP